MRRNKTFRCATYQEILNVSNTFSAAYMPPPSSDILCPAARACRLVMNYDSKQQLVELGVSVGLPRRDSNAFSATPLLDGGVVRAAKA